jgi:Tol biopolymer transport system component
LSGTVVQSQKQQEKTVKTIAFALIACWWVLAAVGGYAQQGASEKSFVAGQPTGIKGPYLGQPVPGKEPKIFASGIVSRATIKVSACTFSPDGKEFYFTESGDHLMVSRLTERGWTYPEPVQFSAGYRASEPHVTYDNKRIYWNWDHPAPTGEPKFASIYVSERTGDGWSAAEYAGHGMFVSSDREGRVYVTHLNVPPKGDLDFVCQVVMAGNRFTGYEDLKGGVEKLKSKYDAIAHPCIAPDGSYIVFDVEGGWHLFVSFKGKDSTWGEAIDLAQNGLDAKAGIASISPDGKYLFFGKDGNIYWVSTQLIEDLRPKK